MEASNHPNVEIFWNYYPFTVLFITPIREVLNLLTLELNRIVFWLPQLFWNMVPEFGVVLLMSILAWIGLFDFLVFYHP